VSTAIAWLDRSFYPEFRDNWDDELFREIVGRHLRPDALILDVGAGAGIVSQMDFRGQVARVVGIDPDPRVRDNPYLDEAYIGVAERTPFAEGSFDLVFADNVLEHIADPDEFLREVRRILKPGGLFLGKTPNRWHYVPLIARLTPHAFHELVCSLRGRAAANTFPTFYRLNSPAQIRRAAARAGLETVALELVEGRPEYLRISALSYLLGLAYERAVNAVPSLALLRVLIIATLRKPYATEPRAA
jgi:SAM-dependent methyltransferase